MAHRLCYFVYRRRNTYAAGGKACCLQNLQIAKLQGTKNVTGGMGLVFSSILFLFRLEWRKNLLSGQQTGCL